MANINEQIHDQGRISGGGMTEQTAKDLALVLNSGALPASISILRSATVGPSRVRFDSRGVQAAIIGCSRFWYSCWFITAARESTPMWR